MGFYIRRKGKSFLAILCATVLVAEMLGEYQIFPTQTEKKDVSIKTQHIEGVTKTTEISVNKDYFVKPLTDTNYLAVASCKGARQEELKTDVLSAINEIGNIGTPFPSIFDSSSTESNYYIETVDQLKYFQKASNTSTFEGITIHLAKNIDWDGTDFVGIGSETTPFKGTFNGHGYAITKFSSTTNGLFAVVEGAIIKNVAIGSAKIVLEEKASNVGILIGEANGATIENVVIASSKITTGEVETVSIGGVIGKAVGEVFVIDSHAKRLTIKTAGATKAVGGFLGTADSTVTIKESNITNSYIKEVYKSSRKYASSLGGLIGNVSRKVIIENTDVAAVNISTTSLSHGIGCVVGTVSGTEKSLFNTCRVSAGRISGSANKNDSLSGFAGMVESPSVFQKCVVENTTVSVRNSAQYIGGMAGYLSETARISDCYVQGFSAKDSMTASYLGGLIGYVSYITEEPSSIASCYVKDINLSGKEYLGKIMGMCETEYTSYSALWHCNVILNCMQGGNLYSCNGEMKGTEDAFAKGEIAWNLNTANGTIENTKVWTQGAKAPIYDSSLTEPTVRVSFVQPSGIVYRYTDAKGNIVLPTEVDQDYAWPTETYFVVDSVVNATFTGIIGTLFPVPMKSKPTKKEYTIKTKEQLESFMEASLKYDFTGITIHVLSDIDWGGKAGGDWKGIGLDETLPFTGTFDGHEYVIDNLYSTMSGLFYVAGSTEHPVTIKNVTLKNAKISGDTKTALIVSQINGNPKYTSVGGSEDNNPNQIINVHVVNSEGNFTGDSCGVIVGSGFGESDAVTIESCTISETNLNCTKSSSTNVKNWGMIIGRDYSNGFSEFKNCTITNSHITSAKRNFTNAGMAVGLITGGSKIKECQVISCSITAGQATETATVDIGGLIGRMQSSEGEISGCSVQNVKISTSGLTMGAGLLAGHVNGGRVLNCDVEGGSINTTYDATETQAAYFGGLIGRLTTTPARVLECTIKNITINNASRSHSIGGLIGSVEESAAESVIAKCMVFDVVLNNTYKSNTTYLYHVGGAVGRTMGKAHITDVKVEGAIINVDALIMSMGGFIGYISGNYPSVLTNCFVNNSVVTQTAINDEYKCYHVGGLVGCVDSESKFVGCFVENTDIVMQGRTYYYGGLIASTYSVDFGTNNREAPIVVKNCYIRNCDLTTKQSRNCNQYGGLIGWLSEGSTVQNCYVSGVTNTINTKCKKIGGLVGYISNTGIEKETTIKSCYVENCDFRASQEASRVIGTSAATNAIFEDLYYYNCVLTGTVDSGIAGVEIKSEDELINGTVVANLNNASLGTVKNWEQGMSSPILNQNCNGTTEVKMLCYNIFYMIQNDTYPIENRRGKVVEYLKKYVDQGVGVMALQEVKVDVWYSYIKQFVNETGWTWSGYGRYGGTFGGYAIGATEAGDSFNLIVYDPGKYIKVDEGHFWLSDTPEIKSAFYTVASNYRVMNWIKLRDRETGEEFVFADIHLEETKTTAQKNPWGYTIDSASGTECRNKQANLIADQLEKVANGATIIQAGDYNAGPGKDAYNTTLERGYQCVRNFSHVADTHGGYNAWNRKIEKFAKGDHVFTSSLCTSNMYDVRAEDDIDVETGYRISDHCAIYTIIQY